MLHIPIVRPTLSHQRVEMLGSAPLLANPTATPPWSIFEAIARLGTCGWPLSNCDWTYVGEVARGIREGKAVGSSDGSHMRERSKEHGAAAWLLAPEAYATIFCLGQCYTSGSATEINSYQSELQGIHAILLALFVICQVYDIKEVQVTLACDNDTAVDRANDKRLDVPQSVQHADLIRAICRLIHDLPITVVMQQVDGHKDDKVDFEELSPHEQLNCLADWDVKDYLRRGLNHLETQGSFPSVPDNIFGEGIRCIVGGVKVTGNPTNALEDQMFREPMALMLDRKGSLRYQAFDLVNWSAIEQALEHRSPSFCAWVTKHVSGQCGVGQRMLEWGFWDTDLCPCCGKAEETTTHYPFCEDLTIMGAYETLLTDFSAWLEDSDTDPCISNYFISTLRRRTFPPQHLLLHDDLKQADDDQRSIGWNNILFGRMASRWMHLQNQYLRQKKSKRAAERWAADLSYQLLKMSHGLWTARNGILHERDQQGLLLKEGLSLTEAIKESFNKGRAALLSVDYHLLERPLEYVLKLSASDKYVWLGAFRLALHMKQEEHRNPMSRMRQTMAFWLASGQQDHVSTADEEEDDPDSDAD